MRRSDDRSARRPTSAHRQGATRTRTGLDIPADGIPGPGASGFERPSRNNGAITTRRSLLVESVQSLANHLEAVGWNSAAREPVATLAKLPYIEVRSADDEFLSSSRLEPHRLAGAYIKDAKLGDREVGGWMIERFGLEKGVPLDWERVYDSIFQLDPLCLVHGVFFSDPEWSHYGNPKVRRAISAIIEAHDVRPAVSGGVKRDDVRPTVGEQGRRAEEGYGFVPFGRTEYTAASIELTAVIDLNQIRGYGLEEAGTRLITLVALWELAAVFEGPLRLRTACDLDISSIDVIRPRQFEFPDSATLAEEIAATPASFDDAGARVVRWA